MIAPGTRIGSYEIVGSLGAGGMGEVYRARDPKLDRGVAVKILPTAFATDAERLARFDREARTLAALNHPHIAQIYGFEESDGTRALIMELVEGETLAELLRRGPVALEDALPIAGQIAEALEAAHELGIVHRDLKPSNIKVRPDGTVKVLDFGLAKALDVSGSGTATVLADSPTVTSPATLTMRGVILGTAAYLSPEQARGKAVDKRADIWAFGCVLYETLTGRPAFDGPTLTDVLAAIVERQPDWAALPAATPAHVRVLLRRCLEKDPKERLRDIGDARPELRSPAVPDPGGSGVRRRWPRRLAWAAGSVLLLLIGAAAARMPGLHPPTAPAGGVHRSTIFLPGAGPTAPPTALAVSPDGKTIVYTSFEPNRAGLHVRQLDALEPSLIPGTEAAYLPFFSPDGEWVGFFTNFRSRGGLLKKVALRGGAPITICDAPWSLGGAWGPDDTIVFALDRTPTAPARLMQVPAAGGMPTELLGSDPAGRERYAMPALLPDGSLLFSVTSQPVFLNSQVVVLPRGSTSYKVVVDGGYHGRYLPSGHLVFLRGIFDTTLMGAAFDVRRLERRGEPVRLVEGVRGANVFGLASFAVSPTGFLVYEPGRAGPSTERGLVWVDRDGRQETVPGPTRAYMHPRIAHGSNRVAVGVADHDEDVWRWDLPTGAWTRLTFDKAVDRFPVWTADGTRLAFGSERAGGPANLYWQAADGTGTVERLTESPNAQKPGAFAPDGQRLIFVEHRPKTGNDLMLLSLDGPRRPTLLIETPFNEINPGLSPDGRWLAYQSDETGNDEVYVRPFPDVQAGRWQISNAGGSRPVWARSGRELFFVSTISPLRMMVVAVQPGRQFLFSAPVQLFEGTYFWNTDTNHDISADDKRFLLITPHSDPQPTVPPHLTLVQNWLGEVSRLAAPPLRSR